MPDFDTIATQNSPSDLDQVTNGPGTSADPSTPQAPQSDAAPQTPQSSPSPAQQQPTQPQASQAQQQAPQASSATVSNQPQPAPHPLVQKASLIHDIAQTLAGGARQSVTIDPVTGKTTRTNTPLTGRQIGMAIAMEALSGAATGISQPSGPNHLGRAAGAGFAQGQQQVAQRQQAQEAQAKQDAEQQSQAFVRQAQAFEANSRTVLNTAQAEKLGQESMQSAIDANAKLLADYDDAGAISNQRVTQADLMAGVQPGGQFNALTQTAIPDGILNLGTGGRPEYTFSIVSKPSTKITLTQDDVRRFADNGVPGFAAYRDGKQDIPDSYQISGSTIHSANLRLQAMDQMGQEFGDIQSTLKSSSDKDTASIQLPDLNATMRSGTADGAALQNAALKFQRWVSHSDLHGMTVAQSLQAMAQPSKQNPDPKGQPIPNPDAAQGRLLISALGNGDYNKGQAILKAYNGEVTPTAIKSESDAQSIIAAPDSSPKAKAQARAYLAGTVQRKGAEAGAEAKAKKRFEGGDNGAGAGNPALINSNPANGVNTAYLQSLPASQQQIVRAIGEGRMEPASTRTKQGQSLMDSVSSAFPDYDASRFHTYQAMQKDFVSGKSAQGLQALNTALGHLGVIFDSANVGSTLPVVSGVERAFGDKSASNLKAAQTAVTDELGRAYKSGVVSVDERKEWQHLIDGWTPASVKASAASLAGLLDSKIASYEQQLRNGAPSGAVKLPALMSPQAAAAYTRITGNAPTTTVGNRVDSSVYTNPGQQPKPQPTVPAGAAPAYSNGKLVGYRGTDNKVVMF